jgi:glutamate formiminotransferase/formiminotetrahydrofolate cyclodeaminase
MDRLIECVPNFSEGRRKEVVDQICARIRSVPGVQLLDVEMDPSHNRAVVTFVGSPEAVGEAAFRAVQEAAQHIDMRQHKGAHPRIGATDVVPFVPVRGVKMEECVALARAVGARIGNELGIPVYLYEEAASRPERKNLADVRRGEYEGLSQEIVTNPERAPDFGPAVLGAAGATAVGARPFLVAYNVYLGTSDIAVANKIARAIRHLSGGLRYIRAMGVAVDRPGQVQVSMNLTDYRRTPIYRAMALIRDEAAHYGVPVLESEIVGLTPAEALIDVARYELQLHHFTPEQVLENRLQGGAEEAGLGAALPRALLAQVAAGTATPGGGTVAAVSGALAAGLTRMVANLTVGKKQYAAVQEEMREAEAAVARLQEELLDLAVQDSAAFECIMGAYRLPKRSPEEQEIRRQAVQEATREAARVPLATVERTVKVLEFLARVAAAGNGNAMTDALVAVGMAEAAVKGAAANVRVNAAALDDPALAEQFRVQLAALESQTAELVGALREIIASRQGG